MTNYKIKSILNNSLLIEYRTDNGTLNQLHVGIEEGWDKKRIEEEISRSRHLKDKEDKNLNLDQYFYKGEELEFLNLSSEEEEQARMIAELEEQQRLEEEKFNQDYLNQVLEYRNTPIDYVIIRDYSYPSVHDQLDALYWLRKGVTGPIEEIDRKIEEIKQKYPKDKPLNLTYGDLDDMMPEKRSTDYLDDLRRRNIQADFLE